MSRPRTSPPAAEPEGPPAPHLGALLSRARLARGVLQRDLATQLEVRVETLSSWERGHTVPDADQLRTLCRILHVSADVLLERRPFELGPMPEKENP